MDSTLPALTATHLRNIYATAPSKFTPAQAFSQGLNIRKAMRQGDTPEQIQAAAFEVRKALVHLIADLCRFVDAKRTITTTDDLTFTVETIIDNYPALTLEELRIICDKMKRGECGKFYERLKLPEIEAAIRDYEANERADVLENMHREHRTGNRVDDPAQIKYEPQTMADLRRKEWFAKFYPTTTGKGDE